MSEIVPSRPHQTALSVRELLAIFHEETARKLELAPLDSRPKLHLADGTWYTVDVYGWPDVVDCSDAPEVIDVRPTSVVDTEAP